MDARDACNGCDGGSGCDNNCVGTAIGIVDGGSGSNTGVCGTA